MTDEGKSGRKMKKELFATDEEPGAQRQKEELDSLSNYFQSGFYGLYQTQNCIHSK